LARRIAYKDAGCPYLDSSSSFVLVSSVQIAESNLILHAPQH
jgi:hypothetical protein